MSCWSHPILRKHKLGSITAIITENLVEFKELILILIYLVAPKNKSNLFLTLFRAKLTLLVQPAVYREQFLIQESRAPKLPAKALLLLQWCPLFLLQGPGSTELLSWGKPRGEGGWLWLEPTHDWWYLHSPCWGQVPNQMDSSWELGLQHLFNQIGCMG